MLPRYTYVNHIKSSYCWINAHMGQIIFGMRAFFKKNILVIFGPQPHVCITIIPTSFLLEKNL